MAIINNKRIAKNTMMLYFRMLLIMAISLYTSRVVLLTLGESNYGIYNVVGGFVSMFAIISGAMTTATQRFLSFEIGKVKDGNVKSIFSTLVIIHLLLALFVLIIAESVGLWFLNSHMNFPKERIFAANVVFQLSTLTFIINIISIPYTAALIAYEKMSAFAYVSIIEAIFKLLIVYLLSIAGFDKLIMYSVLLTVIAIIIRMLYGHYVSVHFNQCRCNWTFNANARKEIFSFVSWNLIGSIASIAKEQGINLVLNIFFGVGVNAAKGLASQVQHAVSGFIGNFQMAMNPQIVKSYANGQIEDMYKVVFRGALFSFVLSLTLSLPIIIESEYILNLWLSDVPFYTNIFLKLVLLITLVDSMMHTVISAMHASGKVKIYQIVNGCILLLTIPLVYLAFKLGFSPYYSLIISLIISLVCHFSRVIILKYTMGFPALSFIKNVTFKALLLSILASIIPSLIYFTLDSSFLRFMIILVSSLLCTLSLSYYICITATERISLKKILYNKINKFI